MEPQAVLEMEFADSEISQIQWHGDDLHVVFSAVSAVRHALGEAPVSGFLQGVVLVLQRCAPVHGVDLLGRIRSGSLRVQGQPPQIRIFVPSRWDLPFALELEPAQSSMVLLQAQALECRLQAGGVFRESLFC